MKDSPHSVLSPTPNKSKPTLDFLSAEGMSVHLFQSNSNTKQNTENGDMTGLNETRIPLSAEDTNSELQHIKVIPVIKK